MPTVVDNRRSRRIGLALLLLAANAGGEDSGANGSLRVLDRNGAVLQEFSGADGDARYPVRLGQVSPWAILATVAAEDRRFFSHSGVDWRALARAAWQNARSGKVVSGGSTLTEQLIRNRDPRPRSLWTKIREAVSALALERVKSKPDILEEYLNMVPYGNRVRGIEAASRLYFAKPAAELSIAEAATLAAIPRAPGARNPYRKPARLEREAHEVLDRMLRAGFLTPELHDLAAAETVRAAPSERRRPAPHFAEYVRRWAAESKTTGTVRTTLDASLQTEASSILRIHLAALRAHRVENGALVILDNRTGEVLAWVGSQDFADADRGQVDGVTALRQPGSALKPFVYGLALAKRRRASRKRSRSATERVRRSPPSTSCRVAKNHRTSPRPSGGAGRQVVATNRSKTVRHAGNPFRPRGHAATTDHVGNALSSRTWS